MSHEPSPTPPSNASQDPQWGAVLSSRREVVPNVILVERSAARSRWIVLVMMASLTNFIMGGFITSLMSEPKAAIPPPTVVLVALAQTATATPTEMLPATASTIASPAPTGTPTPRPSATATASPTPTSTPTTTSTATATPTSTPPPVAIITATALNVRAGPGVTFAIVGYAAQGQRYRIVGESEERAWFRIDFDGLDGWVSGTWLQVRTQPDPASAEIPLRNTPE